MSKIGSIEAFAVLDKHFRPDEVRHGRDFNFIVKESGGLRLFEPIVGNGRNKIAGSEYQVDIKLCLENLRIISSFDENIDIFRRTAQTRVGVYSKPASHHKRELRLF